MFSWPDTRICDEAFRFRQRGEGTCQESPILPVSCRVVGGKHTLATHSKWQIKNRKFFDDPVIAPLVCIAERMIPIVESAEEES